MSVFAQTMAIILGVIIVFAAIKIFTSPFKLLLKITVNILLGFAALFAYNILCSGFGLSLGLNLFNAVFIGLLGLPGLALLIIFQLLFR